MSYRGLWPQPNARNFFAKYKEVTVKESNHDTQMVTSVGGNQPAKGVSAIKVCSLFQNSS